MDSYDWSKFTLSFYYPVEREQAYESWATQAGLESFFIDSARFTQRLDSLGSRQRAATEFVQSGDQYHWQWRQPFSVEGEIRSAITNERLLFSFGAMCCDIVFRSVEGATLVHLTQSDIPDTEEGRVMGHLNCRSCWVFFMTNLASVYRSGLDLRDAAPARVSSMEVGYVPAEL